MNIYFGDLLKTIRYDGKKYTWKKVYDIVYADNLDSNIKLEYINNRYQKNTEFTYRGKKSKRMYFSGDIVFNFHNDPPGKSGKRRLYTEMYNLLQIKKENNDSGLTYEELCDIEDMLIEANKRTERKSNVSIMPCTGSLQTIKQAIGRDRLDTFVWCLDEHYQYGKTVLYNHCAAAYMETLNSFLELFDSVEEYCECIYNISPELTRKLVLSGSKPIDSPQRIREYIILANQFWHERIVYFQGLEMDNVSGM